MMYLLSENEKKTILEIIRQKNPWVETDYYTFLTVEEDMLNSVLQILEQGITKMTYTKLATF